MKIGLVLAQPPEYSETFFISKIIGLQRRGFEVVLFAQKTNLNFSLCKVKVAPKIHKKNILLQLLNIFRVTCSCMFYLESILRFYKLEKSAGVSLNLILKKIYNNFHILSSKLDWLHFGFATMGIGREHIAKAIVAKMAISVRGYDVCIYPIKYPECYKSLWKNVDKVHSISDDLTNKLYELGLPSGIPVVKITPAIDTSIFSKNETIRDIDFKELNLLSVTRLHWKKGIIYTLEALAILKSKGIKFTYKIIGEGDGREEIEFAIHQLDLGNEVKLLGKKNKEQLLEYYSKASFFIQYSISEGFCNAVLEGQAMGLLCVVSDAEGLAENVLNGVSGVVVSKNRSQLLSDSLINLTKLSEKELLEMKQNAQLRVEDFFNLKLQEERFSSFYD